MLKAEQLDANFKEMLSLIDKYISEPRAEKLKAFYAEFSERFLFMPASGTNHFHNAFPGGYLDHIVRVTRIALELTELWRKAGADIEFTVEELVFSALHHDLGKFGFGEGEQYIHNDSEWHKEKLGQLYKNNPAIPFMLVSDRSLFLLQQMGVELTLNEYLAIKLHDGLYEDSNKPYLMSHSPDSKLRTNLPFILHQADLMASRIEYEKWKGQEQEKGKKLQSKLTKVANKKAAENSKQDVQHIFSQFFTKDE